MVGTIPKEIGKLVELRELDLSSNQLQGILYLHNKHITNLLLLQLFVLKGTLPIEITYFRKLIKLVLSHNQLSGSIPRAIGSMSELEEISLDFNLLEGLYLFCSTTMLICILIVITP